MSRADVSVIIPCYKQAQYLRDAVKSALCQTIKPLEVIVIDDCDPDPQTITDALYGLPVTLIRNGENKGVAAARNEGIRRAEGRYILPLDSDDTLFPDAIENLQPVLEKHANVAVAFGDVRQFGLSDIDWNCTHGWPLRELFIANQLPYSSLFKKVAWGAVGGYCETMLTGYEDWEFWISLARRYLFMHVAEPVLKYRRTGGSRNDGAMKQHKEIVEFIYLRHADLLAGLSAPNAERILQRTVAFLSDV